MEEHKRKGGPASGSTSKKSKKTGTAGRTATANLHDLTSQRTGATAPWRQITNQRPANPYPHLVRIIDVLSLFQTEYIDKSAIIAWDFGIRGSMFYLGEKGRADWFELPKTQYHPSERCKEASVVLYDAANAAAKRVAVGFEAIKKYSHEPDFRTRAVKSFKLHLYDRFEDDWNAMGKPASEVLQDYIENYIPLIQERIDLSNALTVLTTPAKAEPSALYKLREAATRAGLPNIAILPEQEAALYTILDDAATLGQPYKSGSTVAVVDAGGGTIDIGVYQIIRAHRPWKVGEIEKSDSLVGAGEKMDLAARDYFKKIVGSDAWQEFERTSSSEYFEFEDAWDKIKAAYVDGNASFTFYPALRAAAKKHNTYQTLLAAQGNRNERLEMPEQHVKTIFDSVIDPILERLCDINAKHNVDDIIPVGGMSKMPYFTQKLRSKFPQTAGATPALRLGSWSPRDLYVVKGAYLCGLGSEFVASRIVKKTIGVVVYMPIKTPPPDALPETDRSTPDEQEITRVEDWPNYKRFHSGWYEKRFLPIVQIGQKVEENFLYQLRDSIFPQDQGDYGVEVYLLTTTEAVPGQIAYSKLDPQKIDEAIYYDVEFRSDWRGEKNMDLALRFHLAELMVLLRSRDGSHEVRMHPAGVL
ncbi:hypothetical protein HDV00_011306 [Rhizophlyctis rosea]|nr:hypothetical protein HDV00_011306 [Rhizophlyctis rosea]